MVNSFNKSIIKNSLYKRGFLLAHADSNVPNFIMDNWIKIILDNNFILYYNENNKCYFEHNNEGWICICGSYCMDVVACHMDMGIITKNLSCRLEKSENKFLDYLDLLNGRFVCIYSYHNHIYILNDATAARSVFYSTRDNIVASHYNLVNDVCHSDAEPFFQIYENVVNHKILEHKSYPWVMPGNLTPYKDIKLLEPNHKLDLSDMSVKRFWPRADMEHLNIDEACDEIAMLLKNSAETLVNNYRVFESLTSGFDSRITLAATKDVTKKITYFTYHDAVLKEGNYESLDRQINFRFAKNLCSKEGLNFKEIIFRDDDGDRDLDKIYKLNHYHIHIPQLISYYSKMFTCNSIHLRSNLIEIVRENHMRINSLESDDDYEAVAFFMNWRKQDEGYDKVIDIYKKYSKSLELDKVFNYSKSIILYWEHRVASWLSAAVLSISDFACDTFQLFNCRRILQLGISLPTYYKNRSIIYDLLLKKLWPDLLNYGLPNNDTPLFELVDKNQFSSSNLDNFVRLKCGNLYDASRMPHWLCERRVNGMSFGFTDNDLKKGDFCEVTYLTKCRKNISYCYQLILKTFWFHSLVPNCVNYEIIINDKVIYSLSTSDFFSANQIMYCFKSVEDQEVDVKIRLVAVKDICTLSYEGTLDIILFDPKQDFANSYNVEPVIVDTYGALKGISG